jgi:hypothetical protein
MMGDRRIKYLEMLQAVITRMAGNQFSLRTWSVALGTAVIGYAASRDGRLTAAFLATLPAVVFWIADAYYLALERKFRGFSTSRARCRTTRPASPSRSMWGSPTWRGPCGGRPSGSSTGPCCCWRWRSACWRGVDER